MKKIVLISISIASLFAANPNAQNIQMNAEKMFQILKPKMSHMYEVMIPAIEKTEKCIESAKDKKDFVDCSNYMMNASKDFMPQNVDSEPLTENDLKDMKWTQAEKDKILKDLRRTKNDMKKMKECIDKSQNMQNLDTCMKEVGVER